MTTDHVQAMPLNAKAHPTKSGQSLSHSPYNLAVLKLPATSNKQQLPAAGLHSASFSSIRNLSSGHEDKRPPPIYLAASSPTLTNRTFIAAIVYAPVSIQYGFPNTSRCHGQVGLFKSFGEVVVNIIFSGTGFSKLGAPPA